MCPTVTIFGYVAVFIAFGLLILLLVETRHHHKRIVEITKMDVINRVDFNTQGILLDIIDECFTDYKIMYLLPKSELYITDEREKQIRADLVSIVSERISEIAISKLTVRYNEASIAAIIADKIYIVVMNYVIEHNTVRESAEV